MAAESIKKWLALTGISILSFIVFLDFTIVNTILPGIQRDLHATVDELQMVMNAFFLMLTVFMVTMGRVGDIYGRRRVLYAGVIVFAAASIIAGTAGTAEILIACRFVQGIAGAILLTCGVALVEHHFPEPERGRAVAVFMSITGFGMAAGPVIGGLLMSALSWRWAFYVNVPIVVLGFLVALGSVQETPRQEDQKIDWLGLALLTPGMTALVTAIMKGNEWGWGAPETIACAVAGVVFLGRLRADRAPGRVSDHRLQSLSASELSRRLRDGLVARRVHRAWELPRAPLSADRPRRVPLCRRSDAAADLGAGGRRPADHRGARRPRRADELHRGRPSLSRARSPGPDLLRTGEPGVARPRRPGAVRIRLGIAAGEPRSSPRPLPSRRRRRAWRSARCTRCGTSAPASGSPSAASYSRNWIAPA